MKRITSLLIALFPFLLIGQTWTFEEGGNPFDGKYRTSSVVGKGTNFPYNKPSLVVNKFDNGNINFYISNGGYFQSKTNIGVYWVFDNEPDIIYSTYDWSISNDGKILFFKQFNNPNDKNTKLQPIEIIDKLTTANSVSVRMKDMYGSNDILFSLSGSTKAINFVIPKEKRDFDISKIKEKRIGLVAENSKKEDLMSNLLESAKSEGLQSSSIALLESKIERDLGIGIYSSYATGRDYKSIVAKGRLGDAMFEEYGYVDVFYVLEDGSEDKILGTWKVEKGAPVYNRLLREKEEKDNKSNSDNAYLNGLLKKYIKAEIIEHLKLEINKRSRLSPSFDIVDILDVKTTFSSFQYGNVWDAKVEILLKSGVNVVIDNTYIYSSGKVKVTKKDLKNMGAKLNIAF